MNRKYRKTIIAGNWKMNMRNSGVKPFIEELKENLPKTPACDGRAVHSRRYDPQWLRPVRTQGRRRRTGRLLVRKGAYHR